MTKLLAALLLIAGGGLATAAERRFDFESMPAQAPPPGFRSTISGQGQPGNWIILTDDIPSPLTPLTSNASAAKGHVLAQISQDPTDEHFPLLVAEGETYGDFTLTTRFKTVRGAKEQMAGIAFRIQDENNYYLVRASSLGNTFKFYKFINGQRSAPIGPSLPIPAGVWHELTVQCQANQIRCLLNGQEVIPSLTDNSLASGKIGFWTKSDSVSYFTGTRLTYTPLESPAQKLVRDLVDKTPKILGLQISILAATNSAHTRIVASHDPKDLDQPGDPVETRVIQKAEVFCQNSHKKVAVFVPLRDRNGDIMASVRVTLKAFPGQTDTIALARVTPVVQALKSRLQTAKDLEK